MHILLQWVYGGLKTLHFSQIQIRPPLGDAHAPGLKTICEVTALDRGWVEGTNLARQPRKAFLRNCLS